MHLAYTLGSQRRWWLWYLPLVLAAGVGSFLPGWWEWLVRGPVLFAGVLLLDGNARWRRDETAGRVAASGAG
ncbi:MAG: hypothetical protein JWN55_114 [Frankiales bacterium]|jgi:hypothetical protein|nr:hypothetical protein [Frankiales bacterium]